MMLAAVILIVGTAMGQEEQEEKVVEKVSKKEARKLKREQHKRVFEINKAYGMNLMENRDFVLQADRISGRNNMPIPVDRTVNFIKIEGDQMVIQYGLLNQIGLNGLGGATFEGVIRDFDTKDLGEGKGYNVRVQFYTPVLNGVATVMINVRGEQARASLWTNGRVINFEGFYGAANEALVAESPNNRVVLAN